MKNTSVLIAIITFAVAGVGAGYWWGTNSAPRVASPAGQSADKTGRKILYYRNPMGQPDTSPVPKKAPDGMDYVPVYADEEAVPQTDKSKRKILYYRNPMGLPDTSPVPKKDQMGMDYIPVYEGEDAQSGGPVVKINTNRVQTLGVRTEAAAQRELTRTVSAVGTVQVDERQIYAVAPRFEGWIEQLHVNTTGQYVKRGEPLMEVYSPDLITAQQEYFIALRGMQAVKDASPETRESMERLMTSAITRLRNWDISEQELQRLQKEPNARQTLTLRSPVSGVVLEKPALKGMRFMPGEALYKIANLSSLWLQAEVFEQDLALVKPGQSVKIMFSAYPGKAFSGKVAFVYPTVAADTRTAKVRIELANPGGQLKPDMYATVELAAGRAKGKVLTVPRSAVLDTGTRQVVLVERGEGQFEPRTVKLGMYADDYVEVLDGIREGEKVVVSANFLIDAESNLKAALGAFGTGAGAENKPSAAPQASAPGGQAHQAQGTINSIDAQAGTINVNHGAIPSLNWPAMTMDFTVKDKAMLKDRKPGEKVDFDIVQQGPGQFVVTRIAPAGAPPAASAAGHAGH